MAISESTPLCAIRMPRNLTFEESKHVEIIDQLLLPHEIKWVPVATPDEAFDAIKSMRIRGAPAIASLAALSIACDLLTHLSLPSSSILTSLDSLTTHLDSLCSYLLTSRPTAVNLREALYRIKNAAASPGASSGDTARRVVEVCKLVWSEDVERNRKIGHNGAQWVLDALKPASGKVSMLTVCNTGSLATSGYGTALGVITALHERGALEHCYYMQTGPYMQGARLTSMELQSLGIPSSMVCDTAAGSLLRSGAVDAFVAGADRIAANGDTANKISTYQISLLCKYAPKTGVPVLMAAPLTTLDLEMDSGEGIEIEQRPGWEACTVRGKIWAPSAVPAKTGILVPPTVGMNGDEGEASKLETGGKGSAGEVVTVLITPENTNALNPAFDVTPASLISAIITEVGVTDVHTDASTFDLRDFVQKRSKTGTNEKGEPMRLRGGAGGSEGLKNEDGTVNFEALNKQTEFTKGKYAATAAAYERNMGKKLNEDSEGDGEDQSRSGQQAGLKGRKSDDAKPEEAKSEEKTGESEAKAGVVPIYHRAGGGSKNPDGTVNPEFLQRQRMLVQGKLANAAAALERNKAQDEKED